MKSRRQRLSRTDNPAPWYANSLQGRAPFVTVKVVGHFRLGYRKGQSLLSMNSLGILKRPDLNPSARTDPIDNKKSAHEEPQQIKL